jgi:CubicO group peptidase (beta-lactamase class C family)
MRLLALAVSAVLCAGASVAQSVSPRAAMDAYLQPYIRSGNLAGDILVEKDGLIIFERAYGFADRERRIRNTVATRFHIASVSMQFTAAAVLRLVDAGSLSLDRRAGDFVPDIEGANRISIRDLLTERSGLPDINALPEYGDVLQRHQTPATLVAKIQGRPLLFEPGSKFLHEEHSAYNLLALIVERQTGLPFAAAVDRLVFRPAHLRASGVDDDSAAQASHMAVGYAPEGTYGLKRAQSIHWSAKAGNASVYTTARNEARWVAALFRGRQLSAASLQAVMDTSMRAGYGWFKGPDQRFGETAYYMNGRAPGFASFVLYLPKSRTTVVVLSNIYSSVATPIGYDLAALSLGLPYKNFHLMEPPPDVAALDRCTGSFQFGSDFFEPNALLLLTVEGHELRLRWPSGSVTALIPLGPDRFLDRSYWADVGIERGSSGKPAWLSYDRFRGKADGPRDP